MTAPVGSVAASEQWDIYVDESGNFAKPTDDVICAGLLVHRRRCAFTKARIRSTLESTTPELPWPFHAAHFDIPFFIGLAALHQRDTERVKKTFSKNILAALPALEAFIANDAAMMALFVQYSIGSMPTPTQLRQADRQFEKHDIVSHRAFLNRSRNISRVINRTLRILHEEHLPGAVNGTHVFVAGETHCGAAYVLPYGARAWTSRYNVLLASLVKRVSQALERMPGEHVVDATVLERDARDAATGIVTPMRREQVEAVARSASCAVTVRVREVPAYRDGMDPALVLADFIAYTARPLLRKNTTLSETEHAIHKRVGLPVSSGDPARSHLAAEPALGTGGDVRAWAREANEQW